MKHNKRKYYAYLQVNNKQEITMILAVVVKSSGQTEPWKCLNDFDHDDDDDNNNNKNNNNYNNL